MIATHLIRLGRTAAPILLVLAFTACKPAHDDRPAAPATGEPAPAATVAVGEDRGRKPGEESAATPEADQDAFSHVDSGEAERAASKRGHDSAEQAVAQPGSGG
jgi:hypothetical protein